MRHAVAIVAVVGLLFLPSRARADGPAFRPKATLEVARANGSDACPARDVVADAVSARLGYEPFVRSTERPDIRIRVHFTRESTDLAATIEALDPVSDAKLGEKRVTSKRSDCVDIADATTLTIAILLDPQTGLVKKPVDEKPEPSPFTPPEREESPRPPPLPMTPSPPALVPRVRLGVLGSVGAAPEPSVGARASFGLAFTRFAVDAELRADLPRSAEAEGRTVTSSMLAAGVSPCLRASVVETCMVFLAGALHSEAERGTPPTSDAFHAVLGPRLAAPLPLSSMFALYVHADGLVALTRTIVRVDGIELYRTPFFSAALGLALQVSFP